MKKDRLRFQKGDILVIIGTLLLGAAVFLCFLPGKEPAGRGEVYQNGVLLHTLPLSQDASLEIGGNYTNTVTVKDGAVAVTASDCPGEDCVSCGWMSGPGRSIVCLPNALELRLVGADSDVDFVVG